MAEFNAIHNIGELKFEKLLKYYVTDQIAIDESVKSDLQAFLLFATNMKILVSRLQSREQMVWHARQAGLQQAPLLQGGLRSGGGQDDGRGSAA